MKKILSLLAAGALALGFMGCSGNLHDDEESVIDLSNGAVPGDYDSPASWDNTTKWDSVDSDTNTYTFNFKSKADCDGSVEFKIVTVNGEWDVDGYADFSVAVDGDAVTAKLKAGNDMSGAKNATITGCKASTNYTMTVVSNPDTTITVKVESASGGSSAPVPYYLDGYFLEGSFLESGWNADADNLLTGAKKASDGSLTYELKFSAKTGDDYFAIVKKSDNSRYHGEIEVGKDPIELENTDNSMTSSISKGITEGKAYKLIVTTTPDGTVSAQIVENKFVKLAGFAIVNLDSTIYTEGMKMKNAGEWNKWAGSGEDWNTPDKGNVSEVKVLSVNDDEVYAIAWELSDAQEISDNSTGKFLTVPLKDDNTPDWEHRIAFAYCADKGDASADIDIDTLNGKTVWVVADVSEVEEEDEVQWLVLSEDDEDVKNYIEALSAD